MTHGELMKAAQRLATQRLLVGNLGLLNVPVDPEKRIEADAVYMIERDKLEMLELDYRSAFRQFALDQG